MAQGCEGSTIAGPEVLQAAAFGAVARPPPILVVVGLTPLVEKGYAPAALAVWMEGEVYKAYSAASDRSVLDTLDASRLAWPGIAEAAAKIGSTAGCLAGRLEEEAGARLATPWWEPRVVLPREAVIVLAQGDRPARSPGAAVAALWLRWVESRAASCRGPDCPGAGTLTAMRGVDWGRLEEEARIALLESHGIFPLYSASGGEAGRVALPGRGVGAAVYYRRALRLAAEALLPGPSGRPLDPVWHATLALGGRVEPPLPLRRRLRGGSPV